MKAKRILITRTDRLGDVVLSTPVIRQLRNICPDSYIAFMVRPENKDVVMHNPHIDEVTGGTMAIEKAANALADELITKILEKWRSRFYDLNDVKLLITGMNSFTEASNFKNALQFTARGVKNVFQRNVAGGTAEFDIKISGNAEQLARELDQRDIGDYSLAVTGATANKVTLKAVRKQAGQSTETNDNTLPK